jgi:glycosyltransferase involved in cell wall biosynthesis
MTLRIVHLVQDTTPGGVMRLVGFVGNSPGMRALGTHEVVASAGGLSFPPRIAADVIVSHMGMSRSNLPFYVALRAANPRAALVYVEHGYSEAFLENEVVSRGRFRLMLKSTRYLFDRVVTISTAQDAWLRRFAGLGADRTHLIRSCVDLDAFLALPPPPADVRRIGAIGRLHPQKGFDVLVRAFRLVDRPDVSLEIFGQGPEHARLVGLADSDPRIVFHGHSADPTRAMAAVDAVAMPSRWEPYGLVALEAMAAGRPLLVSPIDGMLDHVDAGAFPVPDFTPEAWARALTDLVDGESLCDTARARARAEGAEERFVSGWKNLLDGLPG